MVHESMCGVILLAQLTPAVLIEGHHFELLHCLFYFIFDFHAKISAMYTGTLTFVGFGMAHRTKCVIISWYADSSL